MAQTPPSNDPTGGYRNAPTSAPAPPGGPNALPSDAGLFQHLLVVDTAKILRGAAEFRTAAEDARTSVADARQRTEGGELRATPWGSDPLGTAFGSQYVPVAQAMDQALDGIVGLLSEIADRLTAASGLLTGADDFAMSTAKSLRSGL
jgi:hypothetical protein